MKVWKIWLFYKEDIYLWDIAILVLCNEQKLFSRQKFGRILTKNKHEECLTIQESLYETQQKV